MEYRCPYCQLSGEFASLIVAHIIKDHQDRSEVAVPELAAQSPRLIRAGQAELPDHISQVMGHLQPHRDCVSS